MSKSIENCCTNCGRYYYHSLGADRTRKTYCPNCRTAPSVLLERIEELERDLAAIREVRAK